MQNEKVSIIAQVTCHEKKCYCVNDFDDCDNLIGIHNKVSNIKYTQYIF